MKQKRGRDKFKKFKPIIIVISKIYSLLPKSVNKTLLEFHRNTPGLFGITIRYAILKNLVKEIGDNVSIHTNVYILNPEGLVIKNNVSIHPMCYIDAKGNISIGNDVSVAHGTSILSTEHNYKDLTISIKDQKTSNYPTKIEDNVWIGSGVKILSGSHIAQGCIIAAGAVVNKNTIKNTIYGGVPIKKLKER